MADTTETPQETLRAATRENAMKPSRLTLLGTVIEPDAVRALIRLDSGRIKTVAPGDQLNGESVVAIEDGSLILAAKSETRRLHIPGG